MGKKDFVTFTPESGQDNGSIGITVSDNTNNPSRTTNITVAGGGLSKSVEVSQDAGETVLIVTSVKDLNVNGTWSLDNFKENQIIAKDTILNISFRGPSSGVTGILNLTFNRPVQIDVPIKNASFTIDQITKKIVRIALTNAKIKMIPLGIIINNEAYCIFQIKIII